MGEEINLLTNYPQSSRNVEERGSQKTEKDREIARKFEKEFFDGDRSHGYGGFNYHSRFWQPVIPSFKDHYHLNSESKILDVGCAKGFMLHDFRELIPGISVRGIDISQYAIEHSVVNVKPFLQTGNAIDLPFEDNSFDLIISINTIHNLDKENCAKALAEIERVSRGSSFLTVDAWRNEQEKKRMLAWNLTAKTLLSVNEWKQFFDQVGYTGDYYWFIP